MLIQITAPIGANAAGKIATELGVSGGAASLVTKAATLLAISVLNDNTGVTVYVQIFDKATAPVGGDIPLFVAARLVNQATLTATPLPATYGVYMANGIAVGISTTRATFTSVANVNYTVSVFYSN
jgi:hypothetical protein